MVTAAAVVDDAATVAAIVFIVGVAVSNDFPMI